MTPRKSFGSDNHAGVHPAVLRAIVDANSGDAAPYGADARTEQATASLRETFGAEDAFLVLNGSGANVLGLSLLLRRHEAVICAESAHINTDECGSSERLIGTKLLLVPAADGKITPELIAEKLSGRGDDHRSQPGVVAITQSTELGTCYTLAELRKIADFCHASDLRLYLDGARLANATASLDCSLAELAECADVLSFGGTKNGAMGAEALMVMRPAWPPTCHTCASSRPSSPPRCASWPLSSTRSCTTISGALMRCMPTPWPAASPRERPPSMAWTSCIPSRPTPSSPGFAHGTSPPFSATGPSTSGTNVSQSSAG